MCTHCCTQNFGVHTQASEITQQTLDAHHGLTLGLLHYTCGVTSGTVVVGNEIQLCCNWLTSLHDML